MHSLKETHRLGKIELAALRKRIGRGSNGVQLVAKNHPFWYNCQMSPKTKWLLERVASWPMEDQEELASVAQEIELRRTGIYHLSEDERRSIRKGIAAAAEGDFAPQDEMEEFYKLHREA